MGLKEYDVYINGRATTVQLSDEDARSQGLLDSEVDENAELRAKLAAAEAKLAAIETAEKVAEGEAKAAAAAANKQAPAPQNKGGTAAASKGNG